MSLPTIETDVFVAGCGIAGTAAALFAAQAGLQVVQAGSTAEIVYASGLFDVFGTHATPLFSPWDAFAHKAATQPEHPFAKLDATESRAALESFLAWLGEHGLPYIHGGNQNLLTLTPMGAIKETWAIPQTCQENVPALAQKAPTLLVDFEGLREYSAAQILAVAQPMWPTLRAKRLPFPVPSPMPLLPGAMAQSLELPRHAENLAKAIAPHVGNVHYVGLPAIAGIAHPTETLGIIASTLSSLAGRDIRVFEIPTLPASVAGLRLKNLFESRMDKEGVTPRRLTRALHVHTIQQGEKAGWLEVELGHTAPEEKVLCRHMVLATGRFIGHGLKAERTRIHETIMDLPVAQPAGRELWHSADLFDPAGHPINSAGLMVNHGMHVTDFSGFALFPNLYACGAILAHQDWLREKCGVGLAVATAWRAIQSIQNSHSF